MTNTIETQLAQAQKEFEKAKASILNGARTKLESSLNKALADYEAIPDGERDGILSGFTDILKAFGLTHRQARKQKAPSKFTDDQLLAFLASERTTREIIEHFDSTNITIKKRLKALVASKKVTEEKRKTSKFWKKA